MNRPVRPTRDFAAIVRLVLLIVGLLESSNVLAQTPVYAPPASPIARSPVAQQWAPAQGSANQAPTLPPQFNLPSQPAPSVPQTPPLNPTANSRLGLQTSPAAIPPTPVPSLYSPTPNPPTTSFAPSPVSNLPQAILPAPRPQPAPQPAPTLAGIWQGRSTEDGICTVMFEANGRASYSFSEGGKERAVGTFRVVARDEIEFTPDGSREAETWTFAFDAKGRLVLEMEEDNENDEEEITMIRIK